MSEGAIMTWIALDYMKALFIQGTMEEDKLYFSSLSKHKVD